VGWAEPNNITHPKAEKAKCPFLRQEEEPLSAHQQAPDGVC